MNPEKLKTWAEQTLDRLQKGDKPPPGFTPIPGSKHGGWHKKEGGKWVTWYPSGAVAAETFSDDQHEARYRAGKQMHDRIQAEHDALAAASVEDKKSAWINAHPVSEEHKAKSSVPGHPKRMGWPSTDVFSPEEHKALAAKIIARKYKPRTHKLGRTSAHASYQDPAYAHWMESKGRYN